MMNPMKVLIVSRSKETIEALQHVLRQLPNVKSAGRVLTNGHADPLYGVKELPDVLMLQMSYNWDDELEALNIRPPALRPVVLAVGPSNDPAMLRRAMQAGVRDILSVPVDPQEVAAALENIRSERQAKETSVPQRMTVVLNAKGGSGATLIGSNLSHIMAAELKLKVVLMDLDVQLGTSALYLNLNPKVGIGDALNSAHEIDATALRGYVTKHKSGLDVLASAPNAFVEPAHASPEQLEQLLGVMGQSYDHIVVDLPRSIDSLTLLAIARADRILIVLQQSLSHLQDAKRLVGTLRGHVEAVDGRMTAVVNRFNRRASIGQREIEYALGVDYIARIPNDYKRVCQAEALGVPLLAHAPSAPITGSLRQLARSLSGVAPVKKGLLRRMFAEQHAGA